MAGASSGWDSFEVDTGYGYTDAWVVHADSVGNFLSEKVNGSSQRDEATMIYPLSGVGAIVGGYYSDSDYTFSGIPTFCSGTLCNEAFVCVLSPFTTSIEHIEYFNCTINVYPNPTNYLFTIENRFSEICNIKIYDIVGTLVYCGAIYDKQIISTSNWHKGIYFIKSFDNEGNYLIDKLIKNN